MCRCNIIKEIHEVTKIHNVLDKFSDSLNSLARGNDYRKVMAEKFFLYGKFIVMFDEKGEEIGFVAFYCNDVKSCTAYISMFAVARGGRGYGVQLINKVMDISKQNEMKKIKLEVNKTNNVAINFYRKVDFSIVEESEESYYMERDIRENV